MEILEFPLHQWVNHCTGTTEFTTTIHLNNLAYLDWQPTPCVESTNVLITELHACLNHLPLSAVKSLMCQQSVIGLLHHVDEGSTRDLFCEDCVNSKLTCVPHTTLAASAERPLLHIFSDVHSLLPMRSHHGHYYWVMFIDDYLQYLAVYFITKKSEVFGAFCCYKVWVENLTGHAISILCDDKGGEYTSRNFNDFLSDTSIWCEHSICETPQQLGVAEHMNCSISEGIVTLLLQSGLAHTWWEDVAMHWLYSKSHIPSSSTKLLTSLKLFCKQKPNVSHLCPFSCLTYAHLQKDQQPALASQTVQSILIGYPCDYKGWIFWDPAMQKEFVSDSTMFQESVFPFRKPGIGSACPPNSLGGVFPHQSAIF